MNPRFQETLNITRVRQYEVETHETNNNKNTYILQKHNTNDYPMIATLGSHKILDNETTVSNQHNNKSNKEGNNIITYDNLLNNYNIVGGHVRSNNSNYNDVHLLHNLLHNPVDKSEKAITSDNVIELNKNNPIKLRNSNIQIDRTGKIRDNISEPDFKNTLTPQS